MRYNHDKDNLVGTYLRDINFILLRRLAYEIVNQKLYDIRKFGIFLVMENGPPPVLFTDILYKQRTLLQLLRTKMDIKDLWRSELSLHC